MKEKSFVLPQPLSHSPFIRLYSVIGLAELLSYVFPDPYASLHYVAKPMIMLSLLGYFWMTSRGTNSPPYFLVFGAICFSFLGDVFLMFSGELYFLLGLGSFLLAQLAYCLLFRRDLSKGTSRTSHTHRWFAVPIILYAGIMLSTLWSTLGDMQMPVLIYSLVIMMMGLTALDRYNAVPPRSFWKVLIGALLFILSDSLIAFSRFGQEIMEIPYPGFLIMLTYILAQYLIITGWMDGQSLKGKAVSEREGMR